MQKKNIWLLCAFTPLLLAILITPWDYALTQWLGTHNLAGFTLFMDSSFFEGHAFGGADIATLYMITGALLYIAAWLPHPSNRLRRLRPELGFVVASSLITTLLVVHGLKWTIGRARPFSVLWGGQLPFTPWFELGPYNLLDGFFNGSFPSGHTATITIFLTLAYIVAFHKGWNRYRLGCAIGLMTIGVAYLMAIARCMNRSHFVTDCLVIIPINWIIIHFLFFKIFKVPEQQERTAQSGYLQEFPACWELRLCLHGLFLVLGLMALAIGIRGWASAATFPSMALCLVGAILAALFAVKTRRFYTQSTLALVQAKESNPSVGLMEKPLTHPPSAQ